MIRSNALELLNSRWATLPDISWCNSDSTGMIWTEGRGREFSIRRPVIEFIQENPAITGKSLNLLLSHLYVVAFVRHSPRCVSRDKLAAAGAVSFVPVPSLSSWFMRAFRRGTFSRACSHFHTLHRSPRTTGARNRIHIQSTRRANLLIIKKVRVLAHAPTTNEVFSSSRVFRGLTPRIATGLGDVSRRTRVFYLMELVAEPSPEETSLLVRKLRALPLKVFSNSIVN